MPHFANVARIVRHHHERYDGKGYPDGLIGEAIPLGARILTVVDSYSAMVDRRVYREVKPIAEALAELRRYASAQFDPKIAQVFEIPRDKFYTRRSCASVFDLGV